MIKLFLPEVEGQWILQMRYAAEIVSFVVGLTVAFYGLFSNRLDTLSGRGYSLAIAWTPSL